LVFPSRLFLKSLLCSWENWHNAGYGN
jgi:hypothetical protein